MTDSKFCEHGVNVGLKNPPVFCGQCPPDTIESLRAQLAEVTRERDESRASLARVTAERDEAMAALEGVGDALGGLELYALSETAGHVETVVEERDEAEAELARVTPSAEVREAIDGCIVYVTDYALATEEAKAHALVARAWLASLPGGGKEPEGFCACGRRTSECDRSRKACISESR